MDQPQMEYKLQDPDDNHTKPFDKSIICRLCKLNGRAETPYHLATECLRVWHSRRELLGGYCFDTEDILRWEPRSLLEFFKRFDLENKPNTL